MQAQFHGTFRDALNRVRNSAWATQQYVARVESDQGSTNVPSSLAGERIRTAYQLWRSVSDDLKGTDVEFQAGSLVQLFELMKPLTVVLEASRSWPSASPATCRAYREIPSLLTTMANAVSK
jgi:hypothetical protein